MSQDKRAVIIREILYWKKHRLLPEHYCDFLLNLYGNDGEHAATAAYRTKGSRVRRSLMWALALGVITIISIFATYFNAFPLPMQITSAIVGVIVLLIAGMFLRAVSVPLAYLSLGAGSLIILAAGEWLLMEHGWYTPFRALGYLSVCCAIWFALGAYLRLTSFQLCGLLGTAFIYGWVLADVSGSLYGIGIQVAWIAAAVLFLWLGRIVRTVNDSTARAMIAMSFLCLSGPECMLAVSGDLTELAAAGPLLVMTGKLIAAAGLLVWRQKRRK
jgi:hypothetical protein